MTSPEQAPAAARARGVCPVCGAPVPPQPGRGQPRRYCSSRCKSRAARDRLTTPPAPAEKQPDDHADWAVTERLRATQTLTRDAAIDLVASDPAALARALRQATRMIASPMMRAGSWRDVTLAITELADMIPDDTD